MQTELAECDALTSLAHARRAAGPPQPVPLAELTPEQQQLRDARAEQQQRLEADQQRLELERLERRQQQQRRLDAEALQAQVAREVGRHSAIPCVTGSRKRSSDVWRWSKRGRL